MTKKLIVSLLTLLLVGIRASAEPTELRVWRTSDGKQVVRAEAVDARYDRKSRTTLVYLKKPGGAALAIPLPALDDQSRGFAWYDVQRRRAKQAGRPFALAPPGTVKFATEPLSPVDAQGVPETAVKEGNDVLLGIAPRVHALGRPPEGWCGETAVQEALLYYGVYCPQERINEAGNPVHPDLYSNEIPRALATLGMQCRRWPGGRADVPEFVDWVRKQIASGSPVLVGVKIYPTNHEEWGLDHFVLAVGVAADSLVLNTTWGFRYTLAESQLRSTREGFSFVNKYNSYYGISIEGPRLGRGECPVRLFVEQETADRLAVIVKCEGLEPGAEYSLYRLSAADERNPTSQVTFKATRQAYAVRDAIDRGSPAIYRCRKASGER